MVLFGKLLVVREILDNIITVFGQVFYGLDVLIEMNNVGVEMVEEKTRYSPPIEPILVEKMEIVIYYDEGGFF